MNDQESELYNWAYSLTVYLENDFKKPSYSEYNIKEAWHDYTPDLESGEELVNEIRVGVELVGEGVGINPLRLIREVRNAGFEIRSVSADWDRKRMTLVFVHEL